MIEVTENLILALNERPTEKEIEEAIKNLFGKFAPTGQYLRYSAKNVLLLMRERPDLRTAAMNGRPIGKLVPDHFACENYSQIRSSADRCASYEW